MTRFRWTDEALASLRRDMNLGLSYAEIAANLGCTVNAVRVRSYKAGFSSRGRSAMLTAERNKGKPRPAALRRRLAAKARERWADPAFRDRVLPIILETNRKPARCRKISLAQDRLRGAAIPPEIAADYRFLLNNKGLPAREALAVLGLLPPSTTASKGA
ncbi:GcrA family cell cycle regulator [Aureimonas phyllosphaerae]|uniref:GcrA family cell cycle regulator n=1 Tax=Aureimonas phyllosphaerae TaxID=1166078 RepID=UPI003A5BC567